MRASAVADAIVAAISEWYVPEEYLLQTHRGPVPADRRMRHIEWIAPGQEGEALRHLTYIVELGDTVFQAGRPRGAEGAITSCDITLTVELAVAPSSTGQRSRWMMARDVAEDLAQHLTMTGEQSRGMVWHCSMIEDLGVDPDQTTYAVRLVGHATHATPT